MGRGTVTRKCSARPMGLNTKTGDQMEDAHSSPSSPTMSISPFAGRFRRIPMIAIKGFGTMTLADGLVGALRTATCRP